MAELRNACVRKEEASKRCTDFLQHCPESPGKWSIILSLQYDFVIACDMEHKLARTLVYHFPGFEVPDYVTNWPDRNTKHKEYDAWFKTHHEHPTFADWPKLVPDLKFPGSISSPEPKPAPRLLLKPLKKKS